MALADIARKAQLRLDAFMALEWTRKNKEKAEAIMAEYCAEVKAAFRIDLKPVITFDADRGELVVDAKPATELDRRMLQVLQFKESGLARRLSEKNRAA